MSIKIGPRHFSGSKRVFDASPKGLAAILQAMAIDSARVKLQVASVTDFIDSSTGVPQSRFLDVILDGLAKFDATAAGGAQVAAMNASIVKATAAHSAIGSQLNLAMSRLGLTLFTGLSAGGTPGTIGPMDLAATPAFGTASVDHRSYVAAMTALKANHRKLLAGLDEVLAAMGAPAISNFVGGYYTADGVMYAVPSVLAAADGSSSVATAAATGNLLALADNVATLAAAWNVLFNALNNAPLSVVAAR